MKSRDGNSQRQKEASKETSHKSQDGRAAGVVSASTLTSPHGIDPFNHTHKHTPLF